MRGTTLRQTQKSFAGSSSNSQPATRHIGTLIAALIPAAPEIANVWAFHWRGWWGGGLEALAMTCHGDVIVQHAALGLSGSTSTCYAVDGHG